MWRLEVSQNAYLLYVNKIIICNYIINIPKKYVITFYHIQIKQSHS